MKFFKEEMFLCECNSCEHQIIFFYEKEEYGEEVFIEIHLANYKGFWKRLVAGVKYIFGYKSRYGHFDSLVLSPYDHERFQSVATRLTEIHNDIEAKKLLTGK